MVKTLYKIIRNFIFLALAALLVNVVAHRLWAPFGWGGESFYVKSKYFLENKERYNAIYVGGSLEYRHIDPFVMDSIAQSAGIDLRSFNLANDGYNMPLQVWVTENILKKAPDSLEYIFLSLSSDPEFFKAILHTKEWVYWHNLRSTILSIRVLWQMPIPAKDKQKFSYFYLMSYAENIAKVGLMDDLLDFHFKDKSADSIYLGRNKNGYFPYDDEEAFLAVRDRLPEEILKKIRNNNLSRLDYQQNVEKREGLTTLWTESFANYEPGKQVWQDKGKNIYLDTYLDLHRRCAEKGIRLIFVMPPKGRTDYNLLLSIYERLPEDSRMQLADPNEFPEFFTLENGYNYHHMNAQGAAIYSKVFGEKFVELMKKGKVE
jgi:hypothetical protein